MSNSTKAFIAIAKSEINSFMDSFDYDSIEAAAKIIIQSTHHEGRVHVTGIGKPSYVAGYIASLLSSTGTPAYFLDGTEAVHGSSGQVKLGDVVIAISNSGETEELKQTVRTLIKNGSKVIGCTRDKKSWLGTHADVCLEAHADEEGDSLNKPPRVSVLKEIMVLQVLSVELQELNKLTKVEYLKWHPGGSLGTAIRDEIVEEHHEKD